MWLKRRTLTGHKKSRFQANTEILAVFYSEKYGDFVKLIKILGVIGTLTVVCSVTWPLNGSEAGSDLVLIKTSLLSL